MQTNCHPQILWRHSPLHGTRSAPKHHVYGLAKDPLSRPGTRRIVKSIDPSALRASENEIMYPLESQGSKLHHVIHVGL